MNKDHVEKVNKLLNKVRKAVLDTSRKYVFPPERAGVVQMQIFYRDVEQAVQQLIDEAMEEGLIQARDHLQITYTEDPRRGCLNVEIQPKTELGETILLDFAAKIDPQI